MKNNIFIKYIIENMLNWSSSSKDRAGRLRFAAFVFAFGYGLIVFQLCSISINTSSSERNFASQINKTRNDIIDRNGQILATNLPVSSLFANPKKIINSKVTVEKLATVIPNLDTKKLQIELDKDKTFVWIEREITPELQDKITALGLPGLFFEKEVKRIYPQGKVTSHVLGYVDRDNNGIAGIEKYFDKTLNQGNSSEPVQLSIDYRIQNIVSEELDKVIEKFSALGGAGIVADVTTGEILALVSKPDFDPHKPSIANADQLFNKASLGAYEMGSGLKAFTFAMGFDTETIQMNDVYNIQDFHLGKFRIKDMHRHDGYNTVPQMFMNSSNIGAGFIALEVGKKRFKEYMNRFDFTRQLPIEIPERAMPLVPPDSRWSDLGLITMSYGYGFSMSPLHYIQGIIPVLNGGHKYPVTLLKREGTPVVGEKILSEETSMKMIKLLRLTVEKGTGKKAAVKGYLVAGKTGTAEKLDSKKGVYLKNHRFSSFIATAPAINPKFVVYIFLDDPRGIKETFGFATAGWTAAPVAGNIISKIGSLYGIDPIDEDDEHVKAMMHVDYEIESDT